MYKNIIVHLKKKSGEMRYNLRVFLKELDNQVKRKLYVLLILVIGFTILLLTYAIIPCYLFLDIYLVDYAIKLSIVLLYITIVYFIFSYILKMHISRLEANNIILKEYSNVSTDLIKLKLHLSVSPFGIIYLDSDLHIIYINEFALRLLNLSKKTLFENKGNLVPSINSFLSILSYLKISELDANKTIESDYEYNGNRYLLYVTYNRYTSDKGEFNGFSVYIYKKLDNGHSSTRVESLLEESQSLVKKLGFVRKIIKKRI